MGPALALALSMILHVVQNQAAGKGVKSHMRPHMILPLNGPLFTLGPCAPDKYKRFCPFWAAKGYCAGKPWMKKRCATTCCDEEDVGRGPKGPGDKTGIKGAKDQSGQGRELKPAHERASANSSKGSGKEQDAQEGAPNPLQLGLRQQANSECASKTDNQGPCPIWAEDGLCGHQGLRKKSWIILQCARSCCGGFTGWRTFKISLSAKVLH